MLVRVPGQSMTQRTAFAPWGKLIAGGLLLTAVVLLLMRGYAPPGPAGEVFRHNQQHGIDATPLFYTGVESATVGE